MPPKKAQAKSKDKTLDARPNADKNTNASAGKQKSESEKRSTPAKRRGTSSKSASADEPSKKAPRRGRSSAKTPVHSAKLFSYFLSNSSTELCSPKDSVQNPKDRSYTRNIPLSPFEELMSAVILSRPISHALGHRSIRTLLNPPYSFNTPSAILKAGPEKVHQSLWDARTQHKAKTAEEIGLLAEVCSDKFGGEVDDQSKLDGLKREAAGNVEHLRETLKSSVKGMGKTGTDIFLRRIQGTWIEFGPFMDDRTAKAVEAFGLSGDAEELEQSIKDNWSEIQTDQLEGDTDGEKQKLAYVKILERAVGADLQGNIDEVVEAASAV